MFLASISSSSIRRIPRDIPRTPVGEVRTPRGAAADDARQIFYNRQWRYRLIHINRTESSLAGRSTLSAGLRCAPSTPVGRILEAGVTARLAAWPGAG